MRPLTPSLPCTGGRGSSGESRDLEWRTSHRPKLNSQQPHRDSPPGCQWGPFVAPLPPAPPAPAPVLGEALLMVVSE